MKALFALVIVCTTPWLAWGNAHHELVTRENHKAENLPFELTFIPREDIVLVRMRATGRSKLQTLSGIAMVLRERSVDANGVPTIVTKLRAPLEVVRDKKDQDVWDCGFYLTREHARTCEVELVCKGPGTTSVVTYCVRIEGWLPK